MNRDALGYATLLEFEPKGGVIRFAGQRALLLDAVAMGLLRKYLVDNFGLTAARAVLTQFGFAHGWRMAEALQAEFQWDSNEEWRLAGPRVHALEGLFSAESALQDPLSKEGSTLVASYEAEQHILHFGRSEEPACWTICGLTSGYISRSTDQEVYVLEDRCTSKGDAACHLIGRTRDEWGGERLDELRFFEQKLLTECLDVSLRRVVDTLKETEPKLLARRRALARLDGDDGADPLGIVAKSKVMKKVVEFARRVAQVSSNIIITGESGTGKERIARLIHDESPRATRPFIAVNCGAIAETLLESELFGHVRGAFSGATYDRLGLFEAANGGTLLLDEIGEVSPGMQVKLLRVLQERVIRRVGENKTRPVDVRLLAATNRNLAQEVENGDFRQDLYYRLKVVELHLPALRERRDDILLLARELLTEASERMKRNITQLTPLVADRLLDHEWPGNVRELRNVMERAVALARGTSVELEDLPIDIRVARNPSLPRSAEGIRRLADVEKDYIIASLELNDGNQTRTSQQLGISSATLYRRLKSYGLIRNPRGQPEP